MVDRRQQMAWARGSIPAVQIGQVTNSTEVLNRMKRIRLIKEEHQRDQPL